MANNDRLLLGSIFNKKKDFPTCCSDSSSDEGCPSISANEDNILECLEDGLFVDANAGGGGGSDLGIQDILDNNNTLTDDSAIDLDGNTLEFKSGELEFTSDKPLIGTRYTYDWATTPLAGTWVDSTPNATIVTDGVKTRITGGDNTLLNNKLTLPFRVGVHNWTITQKVTVQAKSGTSYGFGIRIFATTASAPSTFFHFLLDSTKGYIAYTSADTMPDVNSVTNSASMKFVWSVGDVLDIKVTRKEDSFYASMTNERNGMVSELLIPSSGAAVGKPEMLLLWRYMGFHRYL
jgi:hypothetical protein